MGSMVFDVLQIFFLVLDCIVLLYLLRDFLVMLPFGDRLVKWISILMTPIWVPVQILLKHSILYTAWFDLGPYVLLLILTYLQALCAYFNNIL
jgi:uncharacterized protein YggT (Ycf19 family)